MISLNNSGTFAGLQIINVKIDVDFDVTSYLIVSTDQGRLMDYSIKKIAKLAGITIRTLHHYDTIGLLKPAYCNENGYRYYQEEQLLILQQILFFRELGFKLKDIKKVLYSSNSKFESKCQRNLQ